jgi:hypothetical protein
MPNLSLKSRRKLGHYTVNCRKIKCLSFGLYHTTIIAGANSARLKRRGKSGCQVRVRLQSRWILL